MSGIRQVDEKIKTKAMEKVAQIKIYQLFLLAQVIDLGCKRGAFGGSEATQVGTLFDTLVAGVNKAIDLAETEEINETKLPSISEEVDSVVKNS